MILLCKMKPAGEMFCKASGKKACYDCKKPTMPHLFPNYDGSDCRVCCWCFYFWLTDKTWRKVTTKYYQKHGIQNNGMLCLYCVRKRLGRKLEEDDFRKDQHGFFDPQEETLKSYIARMVKYANSKKNKSLVW